MPRGLYSNVAKLFLLSVESFLFTAALNRFSDFTRDIYTFYLVTRSSHCVCTEYTLRTKRTKMHNITTEPVAAAPVAISSCTEICVSPVVAFSLRSNHKMLAVP